MSGHAQDPLNPTFDEAFAIVAELVRKFDRHRKRYRSDAYHEAQARIDFINKFLIALGWDVNHDCQEPDTEEVHYEPHDDSDTALSQRTPDYSIAVPPQLDKPVVFVEAKRPSADLVTPENYFQVVRYGKNRNHSIGILTNFAELHVIDCRFRANLATSTSCQLLRYGYADYIDPVKFRSIYDLLSRPAVLGGSLVRFAEREMPKPRPIPGQKLLFQLSHKTIDEELLVTLDRSRERLASGLASRNSGVTAESLTEVTQRIIDRLVFIRFLDDMKIEQEPITPTFGAQSGIAWDDFINRCRELDADYNGVVFLHHELIDSEPGKRLEMDPAAFSEVLTVFDYNTSTYLFSLIPIHVLGSIYERFIGNVIEVRDGSAELVQKPEVRKSGGVYYTPQYIVEYIVQNTVGRLVDGKTPDEITRLRFADIACGSGSFLLGIYDYLLRYVEAWYRANPSLTPRGALVPKNGTSRLSLIEKSRILTNNVFGVDIDQQAVEVAQLSLYLRLLKDETASSARQYRADRRTKLLPSMTHNIKCGNSLIGQDFYRDDTRKKLSQKKRRAINAFDWQVEFSSTMQSGGFDAIVGNPPYIRVQRIDPEQVEYLFSRYATPSSKTDLSQLFMERSLELISPIGLVGFICTSQWMTTDYGKKMRGLLSRGLVRQITDFGSLPVFDRADTYPAVFILSRRPEASLQHKMIRNRNELSLTAIEESPSETVAFTRLSDSPWNFGGLDVFTILGNRKTPWRPLGDIGHAYIGTLTGMDAAFVVSRSNAQAIGLESTVLFPYAYRGEEIHQYQVTDPNSLVIYPYEELPDGSSRLLPESDISKNCPNVLQYLMEWKDALQRRQDSRRLYAAGQDWYRHLRPGRFAYIRAAKLLVKGIDRKSVVGLLNPDTVFNGANCPGVILDSRYSHWQDYVLGVLNSKFASFHLRSVCPPKLSGYTRFNATNINSIPIRDIDFNCTTDKNLHEEMSELVRQVRDSYRQLSRSVSELDTTVIQRQINAAELQIDRLTYELYGLTDAEIAIIEEAPLASVHPDDKKHLEDIPLAAEPPRSYGGRKPRKRRSGTDPHQGQMFD